MATVQDRKKPLIETQSTTFCLEINHKLLFSENSITDSFAYYSSILHYLYGFYFLVLSHP